MQPVKNMLYLYYEYSYIPVVASQCYGKVTCCDVRNLTTECIIHYDLIWFDIPYGVVDDDINMLVLFLIENTNPKNFVITVFKNNVLENKWYFYGLPYIDVHSLDYGGSHENELRIYNNVTMWNNYNLTTGRYQRLNRSLYKRMRYNTIYKIPIVLVREILQFIL